MKKLFFVIICFPFFAYGQNAEEKKDGGVYFISDKGKVVLENLKTHITDSCMQSLTSFPTFRLVKNFDNHDVRVVQLCGFDMDKFYEDPSVEKLYESLYTLDDELAFVALKHGKIKYYVGAKKQEGKWTPHKSYEWPEVWDWFNDILEKGDEIEVKMLNIFHSDYVWVKKADCNTIYNMKGQEELPGKLCNQFVGLIEFLKKNAGRKVLL